MRPYLVILMLFAAAGCAPKPMVEIEHPPAEARAGSSKLFPPQCEEIPLPLYPDVKMEDRPEQVSVKVTFTIDKFGRIEDVTTEHLGEAEQIPPYLAAAAEAVATLRCKPAARLGGGTSEALAFRSIPYRSSFTYHFFRDEKNARVAGAPATP